MATLLQIPYLTHDSEREAVMREAARVRHFSTWVDTVEPGRVGLNPALLRELYPDIWRFGPRGNVYVQQLESMQHLLTRLQGEAGAVQAFLDALSDTMIKFGEAINTEEIMQHLRVRGLAEGYPPLRMSFINNFDSDPNQALIYHPALNAGEVDYETLLYDDVFSFARASLYLPLLCELPHLTQRTATTLLKNFCTTWGLPNA